MSAMKPPHVLLAGLVFGAGLGAFLFLQTGSAYYGFHGGFFAGAVFAFAMAKISKTSFAAPRPLPSAEEAGCDAGEAIVFAGAANHFKGIESVGGRLFLTDRRLRFRSHRFNVQAHDESYALGDITHVEPSRTLGFVPNGLLVHLKDGRRERFVVADRATWLARLAPR